MISNIQNWQAVRDRCREYRRRILAISQTVPALHLAPAFSCLEIVDAVYNLLMRRQPDGSLADGFVMSKGHGVMAQYAVLEDLGILPTSLLNSYCQPHGHLGAHPDYGQPGIEASTGSLGHGLALAAGMAYADRLQGADRTTHVVLGDGEMQEGSIWEAIMMAPNLKLGNLVAFLDFNDYQGLGRTTETHPHFLPVSEKLTSFGWEAVDVDGHDSAAIVEAVQNRRGDKPFFLTCRTVKGRGVSYMIDAPIWHYRSPNKDEYALALAELAADGEAS
ncbi:transketolase [Labrys okinawensis]|uniref:transketolase n=1 Tax=Labrys okinawensis TaxID=346911 RepID=UPI0039BD222A